MTSHSSCHPWLQGGLATQGSGERPQGCNLGSHRTPLLLIKIIFLLSEEMSLQVLSRYRLLVSLFKMMRVEGWGREEREREDSSGLEKG